MWKIKNCNTTFNLTVCVHTWSLHQQLIVYYAYVFFDNLLVNIRNRTIIEDFRSTDNEYKWNITLGWVRNRVVMNSNARVKSDIFILPESAVVYKGRCLAGGVDLYFPTAILPMRKLFLSRYSVRDLLVILWVLLYFIVTESYKISMV